MENKLVIGILDIVENKLREFGIQLPDEHREDSTDPIVGYQYAELHDQIREYLEEAEVMRNAPVRAATLPIYTVSLVDSEGYWDGSESSVKSFVSEQESLDYAYEKYCAFWENAARDEAPDLEPLLSREAFDKAIAEDTYVCIQFDDYHIQVEVYKQELELVPQKTSSLDDKIRSAAKEQQSHFADVPGKADDFTR